MGNQTLEFVKAAIRDPFRVSTIFPTSKALAETLLDQTQLESCQSVVELGAGTGAITRHLRRRIQNNSYLGIELDHEMVIFLREKFTDLKFQEGRAEDLLRWVLPHSVNVIVSSLPWTIFDEGTQKRTLAAISGALQPNGVFLTYLCANALWYPQAKVFLSRLETNFSSVKKSRLEWRNIPPAYVFRAQK
jgi:phospholipid N-methyltransferase